MTSKDFYCGNKISHREWSSVQINQNLIFQLNDSYDSPRMLEVLSNKTYRVTKKADVAKPRAYRATLVKVSNKLVLAIGGQDSIDVNGKVLKDVSGYNIDSDTWLKSNAQLCEARIGASACVL